jgi:hypothetical protein
MIAGNCSGLSIAKRWLRRLMKRHSSEGYALVVTVSLSLVTLALGLSVLTVATHEVKEAERWKRSNEAYFLARAAISESVHRLKSDYENVTEEGYIGSDTDEVRIVPADSNRTFSFRIAPVDPSRLHFVGSKYMTGSFQVKTIGHRGQKDRGIEARIERDTFLRYSRFVQEGDLPYAGNAHILADVYVGGDLILDGWPVTFWGDVAVGDEIVNEDNGIFHGDITGTGAGIDLQESVDLSYYRDLSKGLISAEGAGLYLSNPTTINLSLFDFSVPGAPRYNGSPLPSDFNGVVFCEGDIGIKGFLEGGYLNQNGEMIQGITFISADDIVARGDVRTGNTLDSIYSAGALTFNRPSGSLQTQTVSLAGLVNPDTNAVRFKVSGSRWSKMQMTILEDGMPMTRADGRAVRTQLVRTGLSSENAQTAVINGNDLNELVFDPAHNYSVQIDYYSSDSGDTAVEVDACEGTPVNIGLVARDEFYIHSNTARQLTIDAAILARDRSWEALGYTSDHPNGYDTGLWELTVNGPIITRDGGSAGPWSSNGMRYYRYDMDMVEYAPPAFPVPAEWWKLAYWKHLKESEAVLQ